MVTDDRRIPHENEWFDKKQNDIVYCFMASLGYTKKEGNEIHTYLPKVDFIKNLDILKKLLGVKNKNPINVAIRRLEDAGFLSETKTEFLFPYNRQKPYVLVDKQLLRVLCDVGSIHLIKIYTYLLFKGQKPNYLFTLKEIATILGYSSSTSEANKTVKNCLLVLKKLELIDFEKTKVELENAKGIYKIDNYVLLKTSKKLPSCLDEESKEKDNPFSF